MKQQTLPEAKQESAEALLYYRNVRKGWGRKFYDALSASLQLIKEHPEIGTPYPENYRRLNLRGFPYYLAYAIRSDIVWIVAVAHAKRKPKYWIRRIQGL